MRLNHCILSANVMAVKSKFDEGTVHMSNSLHFYHSSSLLCYVEFTTFACKSIKERVVVDHDRRKLSNGKNVAKSLNSSFATFSVSDIDGENMDEFTTESDENRIYTRRVIEYMHQLFQCLLSLIFASKLSFTHHLTSTSYDNSFSVKQRVKMTISK